jgi:hypothetical protein
MVDIFNSTNINKVGYNFYKPKYFFGFGDADYPSDVVRIIKLLYILISFILNLLIFISLLKRKKKKIFRCININWKCSYHKFYS